MLSTVIKRLGRFRPKSFPQRTDVVGKYSSSNEFCQALLIFNALKLIWFDFVSDANVDRSTTSWCGLDDSKIAADSVKITSSGE